MPIRQIIYAVANYPWFCSNNLGKVKFIFYVIEKHKTFIHHIESTLN